jgi:hypothetical protein
MVLPPQHSSLSRRCSAALHGDLSSRLSTRSTSKLRECIPPNGGTIVQEQIPSTVKTQMLWLAVGFQIVAQAEALTAQGGLVVRSADEIDRSVQIKR